MYESLKSWINVPVTVLPFEKRLGTGDKVFGESYTLDTYPVSKEEVVRNDKGVDVVSHRQLYLDGSSKIHRHDKVLFEDEELPIQAIHTFYRNGAPDIKVVYL